jgi:MarR family transcriptional regulator, 2-MHQ and catechol-resistance regulon repressor
LLPQLFVKKILAWQRNGKLFIMAEQPNSCDSVINDERIVLLGLLAESAARLQRSAGEAMEEQSGIPLAFYEVMVRIRRSEAGRLTMSEVANETVYSSGGMTRLIDRMVDAGFVERVDCPTDRRTVFVALTDAGIAQLEQATEVHLDQLDRLLSSRLSCDERTQLRDMLVKLTTETDALA